MLTKRVVWMMLLLIPVLTACARQEVVIPTLFPTPTPEALVEPTVEVEQPAETPVAPADRPTLPPTWTPTDEPSPTVAFTPTADPTIEELISAIDTDECFNFGADVERNPREVVIGAPITVFWKPAVNGFDYEVILYDSAGFPRHKDTTEETSYTFPAELFEGNALYGWTVMPRDFNGVPRCPPRGAEFRALLPSTG